MRQKNSIHIRIIRRSLPWGLAGIVLCGAVYQALSETWTMTAYYPAPYGIYAQLISTQGSTFARDGGSVGIGTTNPASKLDIKGLTSDNTAAALSAANAAGTSLLYVRNDGGVGIGTINPAAKLDIRGDVRVSGASKLGTNAACSSAGDLGKIAMVAGVPKWCNGAAGWQSL